MKKCIVATLLLILLKIPVLGTGIVTYGVGETGNIEVIAITFFTPTQEISPVLYRWWTDDSQLTDLTTIEVVSAESEIPSILLGQELWNTRFLGRVLYVNGKDIRNYKDEIRGSWINSRWLGWAFADSYPYVFAEELGWVLLVPISNFEYWIYLYDYAMWRRFDLRNGLSARDMLFIWTYPTPPPPSPAPPSP